jgi:hypothetical protein
MTVTGPSDNNVLSVDTGQLGDVGFEMVWVLIKLHGDFLVININGESSRETISTFGDPFDLSLGESFELGLYEEGQLAVCSVPSEGPCELPTFDLRRGVAV